jgi:hypothetical protein
MGEGTGERSTRSHRRFGQEVAFVNQGYTDNQPEQGAHAWGISIKSSHNIPNNFTTGFYNAYHQLQAKQE